MQWPHVASVDTIPGAICRECSIGQSQLRPWSNFHWPSFQNFSLLRASGQISLALTASPVPPIYLDAGISQFARRRYSSGQWCDYISMLFHQTYLRHLWLLLRCSRTMTYHAACEPRLACTRGVDISP